MQGRGYHEHSLLTADTKPPVHRVPGGAGLLVLPLLPGQVQELPAGRPGRHVSSEIFFPLKLLKYFIQLG